jgi:hypothetical protein
MSGLDEVYLQYSRDASTFAARITQNSMKWLQYILDNDNRVNLIFYVYASLNKVNQCKGPRSSPK